MLGVCWVCVVCVLCVLCCVFDCERVWGLAAAAVEEGSDDPGAGPIEGSHDPRGGAESKWTGFGSFRTGRLVRVSVCRPGPLSSVPSTRSLPKDPP